MNKPNICCRALLPYLGTLLLTLGLFPSQSASAQEASLDLVRAELASLDNRLTRLRDISDIEKLQRSYGYYVDKQQWFDVMDLFTADGILEIGGRGRFLGKPRIYEYLRTGLGPVGPVPGVLNDHQQFQGIVTLSNDGQRAEGRWSAFVVGGAGWGDLIYENDYVKEDGVWKIKFLHAASNMYASYSSGWGSSTTPNTRPESFLPPPDLPPSKIYLTFPNYYNEPFHYVNPVTGIEAPPVDPAAGGMAFGSKQ